MKIIWAVILILATTACSTVAGAGKDLTFAAEWTKEKLGTTK